MWTGNYAQGLLNVCLMSAAWSAIAFVFVHPNLQPESIMRFGILALALICSRRR